MIKEELDALIADANAPEVQIYIAADANTGTVTPNGNVSHKVGKSFPVIFTPAENYQFRYWEVLDRTTGAVQEDAITISDKYDLETRFLINTDTQNLQLHPVCIERPSVQSYSPQYSDIGVARDTTITVSFSKDLALENDLSKIAITVNGESVRDCFKTTVINGNILEIAANESNLLAVASGTKTVTVRIPSTFYYLDGDLKVQLGSDVTWSYKVNGTTNDKAEITVSVAQEKGQVTPAGENQKFSIGDTFTLKFENSPNYNFMGWSILDSDSKEVPSSILSVDDINTATTKVTVLEKISGVSITPKSYLIPTITGSEPANNSTGYDCDKSIVINFNKPMKADQFADFTENGAVAITKNTRDVSAYYETNLSEDGKKLTIKPKVDSIANIFDGSNYADMVYTIKKTAKDRIEGQNFELQNDFNLNVRLSPSRETVKPEFVVFNVAKTREDALNGTNLLSTEVLDNFPTADVKSNLTNKLWIYCKAKDSGGRIKSILTTETIIQSVDGRSVKDEVKTNPEGYGSFTDLGDGYYESLFEYNFAAADDGVDRVTFKLQDFAGNVCNEVKSYDVCKDTGLTLVLLSMKMDQSERTKGIIDDADNDYVTSEYKFEYTGNTNLHVNGKGKTVYDTVTFTIYSGNSEKNLTYVTTKNSAGSFSLKRKINERTLVRFVVNDQCGNEAVKDFYIPEAIEPIGFYVDKETNKSIYIIYPEIPAEKNGISKVFNGYILNNILTETYSAYPYDLASEFKYTFNNTKEDGHYVFYAMSYGGGNGLPGFFDPRKSYSMNWGNYEGSPDKRFYYEGAKTEISQSDLPGFEILYDTYPVESGKKSIEIKYESFIPKAGINYLIKYTNTTGNKVFYTKNNAFSIPLSNDIYTVSVVGINEAGEYEQTESKQISMQYNGSVDSDVTPPTFKVVSKYIINFPWGWRIYDIPVDNDGGSGLKDNSFEYYYVPTNMLANFTLRPIPDEMTVERNYKKHIAKYDPSETLNIKPLKTSASEDRNYVDIYYDGETEQNYMIFYKVEDKAGNSTFGNYDSAIGNVVEKISPEFSAVKVSDKWKLKTNVQLQLPGKPVKVGDENCLGKYYAEIEDSGKWVSASGTIAPEDMPYVNSKSLNYEEDLVSGKFMRINIFYSPDPSNVGVVPAHFIYTSYIYPDYYKGLVDTNPESKITCKLKNIIEGKRGLSIMCDKPALVHTMYCSVSYEDNEKLWESRAIEAGLQSETSSFDYSVPFDDIPDGYYYTTIVHFADGTIDMTDVKQK